MTRLTKAQVIEHARMLASMPSAGPREMSEPHVVSAPVIECDQCGCSTTDGICGSQPWHRANNSARSFEMQVQVRGEPGEWHSNSIRLVSYADAQAYGRMKQNSWTLVTSYRVRQSNDPVNYSYADGRLQPIEAVIVAAVLTDIRRLQAELKTAQEGNSGT